MIILFLIQPKKRVKCVINQLEKPQERFENSLYAVLSVEVTMYFPSQIKLDLQMREHLHLMNVANVTINGGMDDNFK